MLSAKNDILWGEAHVLINYISVVMVVFPKKEHGLNEEDVNVHDKQKLCTMHRLT